MSDEVKKEEAEVEKQEEKSELSDEQLEKASGGMLRGEILKANIRDTDSPQLQEASGEGSSVQCKISLSCMCV